MASASVVLLFALGFLGGSTAQQKVYTATLTALEMAATEESSGVTGEVTVFQDAGKSVSYIGSATGLEANLVCDGPDLAPNGCGVHVHKGNNCTSLADQGGHLFEGTPDPWMSKVYPSSTAFVSATRAFSGTVYRTASTQLSMGSVAGKAFIVHNMAGKRVACGVLAEVTTGIESAVLEAFDGSGVTGTVTTYVSGDNVFAAGSAMGLGASVDCAGGTGNKCGAHVHSGTSCADATGQGGHYHDAAFTDVWSALGYPTTDAAGKGWFAIKAAAGVTSVKGKAFVVHNSEADRVACGVIGGGAKVAPAAIVSTAHSSVALMAQLALMAATFCMIA